jgi:hypothetical protein
MGIESADIAEEPSGARVRLARRLGIRVVVLVEGPAVRWYVPDRVDPIMEKPPEGLGVLAPRESAAQAHDGNGLSPRTLEALQSRSQILDREQRPAQGVGAAVVS